MKVGDQLISKKTNSNYIVQGIREYSCTVNNVWYSLNSESPYYVWDHFYTGFEIRRLKLKRLGYEI